MVRTDITPNIILRYLAALGLAFMILGTSGCSTQTGQYATAKQQWDSPRPEQLQDELRNRLAHTQHDH
jgi:hypothetical protein